jgi:hypothetical protein
MQGTLAIRNRETPMSGSQLSSPLVEEDGAVGRTRVKHPERIGKWDTVGPVGVGLVTWETP